VKQRITCPHVAKRLTLIKTDRQREKERELRRLIAALLRGGRAGTHMNIL
jgi:hypothetical protein